jgi:hypothetical protein
MLDAFDIERARLRAIFRQSLYAFNAGVISRKKKPNLATERTFGPICRFMQRLGTGPVKRLSLRDPRNHCKTSFATMGYILWRGIQGTHPDYDFPSEIERAEAFVKAHPSFMGVNERWLLASGSNENVVMLSQNMREYPATDEFFRWLWPELTPEYADVTGEKNLPWQVDFWCFPGRRASHPQAFVNVAGFSTRSTMRKVTNILVDDPVNEETWQSHKEVENSITWLKLAPNLIETSSFDSPYAGLIIVTGNLWSDWDTQSYIEQNWPEFFIWQRSAWVCSVCGRENCKRTTDCTFTDEPLWPERYTREGLLALKRQQGPLIFGAQYENQPINRETVKFSTQKCGDCVYVDSTKEVLVFRKDTEIIERRIHISNLIGVLSFDPASSIDPKSCRSALTLTAEEEETGAVFLLDLWAQQVHPGENITALLDMYVRWRDRGLRIAHVGFESVGGQAYVLPAILSAAKLRSIWELSREPEEDTDILFLYRTDRNERKEDRITNLLGWRVNAGLLYISRDLPQYNLFQYEFDRFPGARTNDTVDALAYAEQAYTRVISASVEDRRVVELNSTRVRTGRSLPFRTRR